MAALPSVTAWARVESPALSAMEELERTSEALADSQLQLHELGEKLAFLEQLLERKEPPTALPKTQP